LLSGADNDGQCFFAMAVEKGIEQWVPPMASMSAG
jgi:hypothetical protein